MTRRPAVPRRSVVLAGSRSSGREEFPRVGAVRQPAGERFVRGARKVASGESARRNAEPAGPAMIRRLR